MSLLHLTANRLKRALHIRKSIENLTQEFVELVKGTDLPESRRKSPASSKTKKNSRAGAAKSAKPKKAAPTRSKKAAPRKSPKAKAS